MNSFTGSIPASIGNLAQLLVLCGLRVHGPLRCCLVILLGSSCRYLFTNQLSGSIPDSIGGLRNVQELCVPGALSAHVRLGLCIVRRPKRPCLQAIAGKSSDREHSIDHRQLVAGTDHVRSGGNVQHVCARPTFKASCSRNTHLRA
jgi:hypothetical protein